LLGLRLDSFINQASLIVNCYSIKLLIEGLINRLDRLDRHDRYFFSVVVSVSKQELAVLSSLALSTWAESHDTLS
jgi:hypothetical protein